MVAKLQANTKAEFRVRDRCILCGSSDLRTIWQSSFDDEFVRAEVVSSAYAGDPLSYLQGESFERVCCQRCQMSFHKDILTEKWLKTLYGQWIDAQQIEAVEARKGIAKFETSRHFLKHCLRLRSHLTRSNNNSRNNMLSSPPTLLDFGCGSGRFLSLSSALGFKSVGIDFSESRQGQVRQLGDVALYSTLNELDRHMPAAARFDVITLFQVLEHLADPLGTLKALSRYLKKGGVLVVEVPNCSGVTQAPKNSEDYSKINPLEHINHFTPESLSLMCQRAGFKLLPHGPAYVTTDLKEAVKSWVGSLMRRSPLGKWKKRTSQYFCKV